MLDFFKNMKKILNDRIYNLDKNSEIKEKFLRYKNLVESNNMGYDKILVVNYLISVIVNNMNFSEAVQALEITQGVQDNSLIEEIYRTIESEVSQNHHLIVIDKIPAEDRKYYNREGMELIDREFLKININKLPILLNPWNGKRVIDNLVGINENNVFDGMNFSFNIQNHYLYPMNIIVCRGGNHSQFAAKIKNQGYTIIKELHDYSKIYGLVEFNGENYIKRIDKTIIKLDYNEQILFYSGVIFELGRYILENKYHGLSLAQEKFK